MTFQGFTVGQQESMEDGTTLRRADGVVMIRDRSAVRGWFPHHHAGRWEVLTGADAMTALLQVADVTARGVFVKYPGATPEDVAKHAMGAGLDVLTARAAEFGIDRAFDFAHMSLNKTCKRFFVPFA